MKLMDQLRAAKGLRGRTDAGRVGLGAEVDKVDTITVRGVRPDRVPNATTGSAIGGQRGAAAFIDQSMPIMMPVGQGFLKLEELGRGRVRFGVFL